MKRIVTAVFALCMFAHAAYPNETFSELIFKFGVSPYSTASYHTSINAVNVESASKDGNAGISLAAELYSYYGGILGFGLGLNHAFQRSIKNSDVELGFTSFYVGLKPRVVYNDGFASYMVAQIGISFPHYNHSDVLSAGNGLYCGIGAGAEISKNFVVEVLYSINRTNLKGSGYIYGAPVRLDENITYHAININIGYRFNI